MFKILRNAWKIPDLRRKILYTILLLVVFRLGNFVPVPGMDKSVLASLVEGGQNYLGFLNTLTGGGFSQASIFAMSISPYITASIIMNLLQIAIPALERLAKEGEAGRKKIAQITRYATVVLGFVQGSALYIGLRSAVVNPGIWSYLTITITLTAGTAFLMWLGEQITENGIGNGISLIIFAGIVSRIPSGLAALYNYMQAGTLNIIGLIGIIVFIVAVVGFVIYITQAERRVPVQYAKKVVGRKMYGGQSTHIPIKVNMAGVIPIIFAMSILAFPTTIAGLTGWNPPVKSFGRIILNAFSQDNWFYAIVYLLLIIFFTYFYTAIQFNPVEVANNVKRNGGYVPGRRPGKPTADYIAFILSRITLAGALFLGLIAIIPIFLNYVLNIPGLGFGGTSLLIMVGVAIETVKQIESQMLMRHYKGFLE